LFVVRDAVQSRRDPCDHAIKFQIRTTSSGVVLVCIGALLVIVIRDVCCTLV